MANITNDTTGGVKIGVDYACYALLTSDPFDGPPVYGEVKWLVNIKTVGFTSTDEQVTGYYDNAPKITINSKGEKQVSLTKANLTDTEMAELFGQTVTDSGIVESGGDISPYVAFGFRVKLSTNSYKYFWLYKGQFLSASMTVNTMEKTPTLQNEDITGTFVARNCDNAMKNRSLDGEATSGEAYADTWFSKEFLQTLVTGESVEE